MSVFALSMSKVRWLEKGARNCGACSTLGVDAGVVIQVFWVTDGLVDVVGVLKIARRLSTARSWAWQLSCVRSACMVTVKALRP